MTTSQHIEPATSTRWSARRLVEGLPQAALAALLFALLSGAWLAFFMFVPFDFTPR
jgi:hypothetical protein